MYAGDSFFDYPLGKLDYGFVPVRRAVALYYLLPCKSVCLSVYPSARAGLVVIFDSIHGKRDLELMKCSGIEYAAVEIPAVYPYGIILRESVEYLSCRIAAFFKV